MPSLASYDDCTIWYEPTGEGEPLVVLPGGPGMDLRYLGNLGGLDRHRRLVPVDARASGRSGVPDDRGTVSFVEQARDLEALRTHLGLERFDLLAHSAGCLTAQEYLAAFPGRVGRAVLVAPVGRAGREVDEAELAGIRAARSAEPWYPDAAEADRLLARGGLPAGELAALQRRLLPFFWHRWTEERRAAEYPAAWACAHPWLREAFYAGSADGPALAERVARLGAARTPVLVVAGASDGMVGTAPARAAADAHPGSRLEVFARSGHRPWVEEPERFVSVVRAFLGTDRAGTETAGWDRAGAGTA
ncbi:alpha/beta fold hydrolase [Kitasatospora sp. NPDC056327]|uniref:alpha/beta fold hydrolase n=1 Tax=Kitasatospora sp. NPDC056327 TaxID=3345785 RepID=UPI0035E370C9